MSTTTPGQGSATAPRRAELRDLLSLVASHRALLAVAILLSILASATTLLQPLVVGEVIEIVTRGESLGWFVAVLVALVLVSGVLTAVQHYLLQRLGANVVRGARTELVGRMLRLPVRQYEQRASGDLVSRVGADTSMLSVVISQGLVDLVGSALVFVGALVALLLIDPVLLAVAAVVLVSATVAVLVLSSKLKVVALVQQQQVGRLAAGVARAVHGIRTIRAANATGRETDLVLARVQDAWRANLGVARLSALVAPVSGIATQVALVSVLGIGGAQVAAGNLSLADLIQFVMFLFLMVMPLGNVFSAISAVSQALGALGRIREITDLALEEDETVSVTASGPAGDPKDEIVLENVSFSYGDPDDEGGALKHVDLRVRRGSRVAIVGPSGAGKSTILALLARFYEPTGGRITLSGYDIRGMPHEEVRARLGYVEQDASVLAGSVRDNLLLATPSASEAQCLEVLRAVNLLDLVGGAAEGLNRVVGEGGVMLSGGERQRLAIARALLESPPILLLDESTSNLDSLNERLMRETMDVAAEGRTLLVVAHRLATVIDSDHIVVLQEGAVVGSGTHAELLRSTPLYAALAAEQFLTAETPA